MNILKDNQTFWQTINPLFSTKQSGTRRKIVILENGIITSDKNEVAVRNLDIESFVPDNNLQDINSNPDDILDNIEKLEAYGFGKEALKFIYDYLKDRKQRTKVHGCFSSWL